MPAKIESSAVNDLISLVTGRPLGGPDPGEDLMFQPPAMLSAPAVAVRMSASRPLIEGIARKPPPERTLAVTRRATSKLGRQVFAIGTIAVAVFAASWLTVRIVRGSKTADTAAITLPPIDPPAAAQAQIATAAPVVAPPPAPAPAPVVAAAPPPPPKLIDLRLDSTPEGADVTLIDQGKSSPLGATPLTASIDPSREIDLVFTKSGLPVKTEHLDPRATTRLAVILEQPHAPAKKKVARASKHKHAAK